MSGQHFDAGRDALDFIDVLTRLNDPQTIITSLRDKLASFGFHAFLITGLPETGDRIAPLVLLNGWPDGWFELYVRQNYADDDPIAAHCKTTINPFVWDEVYRQEVASARQQEIMRRASDFKMIHGFCVPIHNEDGFKAVVTMAGDKPDLSRPSRSAIHLMSLYAHAKAEAAMHGTQGHCLTVREREVLTWMAVGKSTEGVAEVLNIRAGTVEAHYQNAARKLGARGRTRTVVEAHLRGEIQL
ncbi:LuxR family quorum sensing-dependent transcriptional regulator [Bosea sp. BE125]|uniref:helix-turn-helix transcriptional regulator n=1 Tax=Bosea sp. BE125 TaxID=2817909 RepID=UPI00285EFE14|nr:LuxR family transcriptional regulator [Bosea sp. BE125]MDR6874236.1 LuxR family quorum sensing-dependent transcriptional regulator [Bosea sp. BE125]